MKKYNLILLLGLFIFCSCDSFLDREPLNSPSDDNFPSSAREMEMALTGCYTPLWLDHESMTFFLALDCVTDMSYDRNANGIQPLAQGAADASNYLVKNYWANFYSGIARCNFLINNLGRVTDADEKTKTTVEGEARFLRAVYYSYLTELFGDVPLIKENLTLDNSQLPRTPKAQVVDFILEDLTLAANCLPEENKPASGHASFVSAMALKARVALYNERWDVAIAAAQEVMKLENKEVKIEDDYSKLFTYDGEDSKEIIFSVQYLVDVKEHALYRLFGSRNGKAFTNKKPPYQLADSWECIDGLPIDKSPLFNPKDPYKNRDPRLGYTIAVPGSQFLGFQFETHGDSLKCWRYDDAGKPVERVDNLEATHPYATFTGLCWRKYCNLVDKSAMTKCAENTIMIRYPEVLLTYAEAKIRAGQIDQSVYDAINKVRQRLSVNMPKVEDTDPVKLLHRVYKERKCEFAGEGLRLFDIRRWKIAEKVMNQPVLGRMKKSYPTEAPEVDEYGNAFYKAEYIAKEGESSDFKLRLVETRKFDPERDYLWPIPDIDRQTNPNLSQNPRY